MNPKDSAVAEAHALRVLEWLAGTEDLLGVFLGSSGLTLDDLVSTADRPETLAAVLDFVLQDDNWVLMCAENLEFGPEEIARVRQQLPGGALPEWT